MTDSQEFDAIIKDLMTKKEKRFFNRLVKDVLGKTDLEIDESLEIKEHENKLLNKVLKFAENWENN